MADQLLSPMNQWWFGSNYIPANTLGYLFSLQDTSAYNIQMLEREECLEENACLWMGKEGMFILYILVRLFVRILLLTVVIEIMIHGSIMS